MVLRRHVPIGILQRPQHIQTPRRSLRKGRRAPADPEAGAARNHLVAVIHLAVVRAHFPIVASIPGLHHLELRIKRKRHTRVLERDVSVCFWIVDLRHHDVDARRRERRIGLALVLLPFATRSGSGGMELS